MLNIKADIISLDDLCRTLNSGPASASHIYRSGALSPETARFPTFGGVAPPNAAGIWSWDASRVLCAGRDGRFFIEPRDPEIWYPNEQASPQA